MGEELETAKMKEETKDAIDNLANLRDLATKARDASLRGIPVGRPANSITIKEYSVLNEISVSTAQRILNDLVKNGKYESMIAVAPITFGGTKIMRQTFYRKVGS